MRLIDADDVKELLLGLDSLPWEEEVDDLVGAIPTAYDVDAVVEELENQAEQYRKIGFRAERDGVSNIADKYYEKQRSMLDIIEIVKGGGKV